MRRTVAAAIVVLCALALNMDAVGAYWSAATGDAAGRARSSSLPAGLQPTAAASGDGVAVSWQATVSAVPIDGYSVLAYAEGTGAVRSPGGTCAAVVAGLSCSDAPAPEGTWRYAVAPVRGAWGGPQSPLSAPVLVDTTAPAVQLAFPANGTSYNIASWDAGCPTPGICGAAADAHGVAAVAVSIRQGSGGYWNGTSFASATEILLPATGTAAWSLPLPASALPADGSYSVRAVATDTASRTSSTTATLSIDATAPRATYLLSAGSGGGLLGLLGAINRGDTVELRYSEQLAPSSSAPPGRAQATGRYPTCG